MKKTICLFLSFALIFTIFSFLNISAETVTGSNNMTNSIPSEYGMAYSFDNQTEFRSGIEYVSEGGLTSSQISLSSSADHTQTLLGNGKSLKISGWSTSDDKIYLLNMLSNKALEPEDFGRAFRVTA